MSISLGDNHLDSREIEERIEELESIRLKWSAGWNMPGYMPDSDPATFTDWESARDYIANEMAEAASNIEDDSDESKLEERAELEAASAKLEESDDESEYGETIGEYHYWITEAEPGQFEDEDDAKEFKAWTELREDCAGYGWSSGIHLIADSAFQDYAEEFASDIGAISPNASWPNNYIDWERAALELQSDYTSTEIDGETYWYREA
jgi:hypothetical protein